jgi:multiple sugar transport system ATP-binding protein
MTLDVGDGLNLPVPASRQARYTPYIGRDLLFGIRPEHITEKRAHTDETATDFSADVSVLEPLGVDTMVFITLNGKEVSGRVTPKSACTVGSPMQFTAHMDQMHLINPETEMVL